MCCSREKKKRTKKEKLRGNVGNIKERKKQMKI